MPEMRDKFLSEEDLDLRNLTTEELYAYWDHWLRQAQASNDRDRYSYSHGVFTLMEEPHDDDGGGDGGYGGEDGDGESG